MTKKRDLSTGAARLIRVEFAPNTFIFSRLTRGLDLDFSFLPMDEPYPSVKNQPPGDYTLLCGIAAPAQAAPAQKDKRPDSVAFVLINESRNPVDVMHIPFSRFSTMHRGMATLRDDETVANPGPNLLDWLKSAGEANRDLNDHLQDQLLKFKQELSQWIDIDGQDGFVSNLMISIEGNITPVLMDIDPSPAPIPSAPGRKPN